VGNQSTPALLAGRIGWGASVSGATRPDGGNDQHVWCGLLSAWDVARLDCHSYSRRQGKGGGVCRSLAGHAAGGTTQIPAAARLPQVPRTVQPTSGGAGKCFRPAGGGRGVLWLHASLAGRASPGGVADGQHVVGGPGRAHRPTGRGGWPGGAVVR